MGHQFDRKAQSQAKHPKGNSGASRAAIIPPSTRVPEWKGPGFVKKVKRPPRQQPTATSQTSTTQEQLLPTDLQQLLLNVFRDTFSASKEFEELKPKLQEINNALVRRDFESAFREPEYLEAYTIRWSPSRALAYANLLVYIGREKAREEEWTRKLLSPEQTTMKSAKIVCFGEPADLMGLSGALRYLRPDSTGKPDTMASRRKMDALDKAEASSTIQSEPISTIMDLHLVSGADWEAVLSRLHTSLETPPTLSKYASATARLSNASFLANQALSVSFTKANVLESSIEDLRIMIGPDMALLTIMFTLNDLYYTSIPKTTAFLLKLTAAAPKNSLLLVVDTPGAYCEAAMSTIDEKNSGDELTARQYPMQWLLDKVLLNRGARKEEELDAVAKWANLMGEDSRLNRLEGLRYPVLENLRFQAHLFKRM